jgi:hypothetical protein
MIVYSVDLQYLYSIPRFDDKVPGILFIVFDKVVFRNIDRIVIRKWQIREM